MGADRLVYIRTDGNVNIAAGHLVRCLSIAQNCLKLNMPVCFLLSDNESKDLLESFFTEDLKQDKRLSVQVLATAEYDDLEKELPEVSALLTEATTSEGCSSEGCSSIYLLDSYFVTERYITEIRSVAKTVYIDDLQLFDYPVDLVINYDVIPCTAMPAYCDAYRKAGKALLGATYTPLRSQFENRAITVKETVSDILITTGGSDPYHFCVEFIKQYADKFPAGSERSSKTDTTAYTALSSAGSLSAQMPIENAQELPTLHVVIGRLSPDREALYTLSKEYSFIKLYENIIDMADLMSKCDLAVSAAGTTLYELCALGVPAISFTMADNQLTAAKAFDAVGAIPCSGDIRTEKEDMFLRIFEFLSKMSSTSSPSEEISEGYENRLQAYKIVRKLVDGCGAKYIATEIAGL